MTDPEPGQTALTRRQYLKWTTTIGLVGTAGCSSGGSTGTLPADETEPATESPTPSSTATPTATASPTPSAKSQLEEGVVYRETQQLDLKIHGVIPEAEEPVPTVIWAHGGGWSPNRFPNQLDPHIDWLAERGYGGLAIEYRLATEASYPAAVRDVAAAVLWVRNRADTLEVDPERLVLAGFSAGGHLAALVSAAADVDYFRPRDAPEGADFSVAAAGTFSAPLDLTDPELPARVEQFMGVSYEKDPESYRQASPILQVNGNEPPTHISHSTDDSVVPFNHARRYRDKLQEAGVRTELILFSGGFGDGHGFFTNSENLDEVMSDFKSSLDEYL